MTRPLSAGHRERLELSAATPGGCAGSSTTCSISRGSRRDGWPRRVATNLATVTAELAASFAPAFERAGLGLRSTAPATWAGLPRPRHVGEDRAQPPLQRAEVHPRRRNIRVLARHRRRTELTVRDTGVGIPAEEIPQLFDRFHRVPGARARSHEGTGIGLALVQQLVQLHDGSVAVTSVEDRGTTFTVVLPFGQSATAASPQFESSLPAYLDEALQWTAGPIGRARRELAARRRDRTGRRRQRRHARLPRPDCSSTGGCRCLRRRRALDCSPMTPDLVLTDVMMPDSTDSAAARASQRSAYRDDPGDLLVGASRRGRRSRVSRRAQTTTW